MKTTVAIITLFLASIGFTNGQAIQKIGYADWEYIFNAMPEFKKIEAELKTHSSQLQSTLEAKGKDIEAKYKKYQELGDNTPAAIRADLERELQSMQEAIQKFQQDAQTSIQAKQGELMKPVYEKVGKAIEDVAKDNGYTFILNPRTLSGSDVILFGDTQYDVSDLVLKKMGVTPPPLSPK